MSFLSFAFVNCRFGLKIFKDNYLNVLNVFPEQSKTWLNVKYLMAKKLTTLSFGDVICIIVCESAALLTVFRYDHSIRSVDCFLIQCSLKITKKYTHDAFYMLIQSSKNGLG